MSLQLILVSGWERKMNLSLCFGSLGLVFLGKEELE